MTNCTIFLGYTSNLISSGVRDTLRFLVKNNMVSVLEYISNTVFKLSTFGGGGGGGGGRAGPGILHPLPPSF